MEDVKAAHEGEEANKLVEACELLDELLAAFDLARAQRGLPQGDAERDRKRAPSRRGRSPDAFLECWTRERLAVLPDLRKAVATLRELRRRLTGPLMTGPELDARKMALVGSWNAALARENAVELPPLCEMCGLPVLLRKPERDGRLSTVCSDICRDARKKRKKRRKRKA